MAINRKVSLWNGLRYRGGSTMWVWVLHRVSGVAMILFISLHVLAGFLTQQLGSDVGIFINTIYESLAFQVFIFLCVLYHVINGIRIILLDLYPKLIEYQREVTWLQWLIFIPVYGLAIYIMITLALKGQ